MIHILDAFQTLPLLWLRATSHRLQHLVIKILHARLIEAASFHNRKLLIECYHPSARVTEPIIYCDYLGTPGLSDSLEGRGSTNDITNHDVGEGPLKKLYSRFRPTRNEPESNEDQHSAGGSIGSKRNNAAESSNKNTSSDVVTHDVSLEAHENFSQLQFSARLGQTGPRKGIFLSIVDILEKKTFRLFRQWLNATARDPKCLKPIWVDGNKKVAGLKVHVQERAWRRDRPILLREDEDQAVNFTLKLEGYLKPKAKPFSCIADYLQNC